MRDLVTLKGYEVDITDEAVIVKLPLYIKEFKTLLQLENGLKYLSYVALISSHKSELVIKGLTGKELHLAACHKTNLNPVDKFPIEVDAAIEYFTKFYDSGITGTIKELYKSFEITRRFISTLNNIMNDYQIKSALKTIDLNSEEEVNSFTKQTGAILDFSTKVRNIATSLDDEVSKLKVIEAKVNAEDKKRDLPKGGGSIPQSANRR